jgi:hypothetical protein
MMDKDNVQIYQKGMDPKKDVDHRSCHMAFKHKHTFGLPPALYSFETHAIYYIYGQSEDNKL